MTVDELAAAARYENTMISYTTTEALAAVGVPVTPTPSDDNPLHATAVVDIPLSAARAAQISAVFLRKPNPAKCKKK
jgi:hypothetical protein